MLVATESAKCLVEIPKRIIQTARSTKLSAIERAAQSNVTLLHPDWEYTFFDDEDVEDFVATECPEYVPVFRAFAHNIQRIDFFRYLVVHKHGGFYLDLDVLLWSPLDGLRECCAVFPFEELTMNRHLRTHYGLDWEIGNYAFGAVAGSRFLAAVIENCVRGQRDPGWVKPMLAGVPRMFRADFEVLNTTGPGMLTRTLAEFEGDANAIKVLFQPDVRDADSWHLFGQHGLHLMRGSWRSKGGAVKRRLAHLWEHRTRTMLLPESLVLGPERSLPVRRQSA
jgi:hypothetical protein